MSNENELILVRSDQGDGGWSLHAPGSTDAEIANGEASPLASGPAHWDDLLEEWDRPNNDDYATAQAELAKRSGINR